MNGSEFIELIESYFEHSAEKFSNLSGKIPGVEEPKVEEMSPRAYYKAWLVLIFNMVEVITEEGQHVKAAAYFAYHLLLKNKEPPYGPIDPAAHRILKIFNRSELVQIFGEAFIEKYSKSYSNTWMM